MIRRTGNGRSASAQLGLPFELAPEQPAKPTMEPIAVRIVEAIRLTGIGRSKLYELIASGAIETVKIGRCTLIPTGSLHRLIEKARQRRS